MSRLARALRAHDTGQRFVLMPRVAISDFRENIGPNGAIGSIYAISATFQINVRSTGMEVDSGEHSEKVQRAKQLLLMEVFGEFIGPLSEALFACENHEPEVARKHIASVLDSMKGAA